MNIPAVGAMDMPADFKYKTVHRKGRPLHQKGSAFRSRHPAMDVTRRAKIFSAFDALKGFDEAIESKEIVYTERKITDPEVLNRKLQMLSSCSDPVTITWFVPCSDITNEAYGSGLGLYKTVTGSVRDIDPAAETLTVSDASIRFEDICEITCAQDIM